MKRKAMNLPRPLLHRLRIADEILFYPALLTVIWGELGSGPEPPLFDWLGNFKDKALHFIAYFGLAAIAAAGFKRRGPAGYAASVLSCLAVCSKSSRAIPDGICRLMTKSPTRSAFSQARSWHGPSLSACGNGSVIGE